MSAEVSATRSGVISAEVAVVGGGPAGCATAITLLHAGVDVVLLAGPRRGPSTAYRPGEGAPPGTDVTVRQVFGPDADAFDAAAHVRSYATRSAWGDGSLTTVDHMFNPFGPGWVLDRQAFDARLLDAVVRAGGRVIDAAEVVQSRYESSWVLTLGDGCGSGVRTVRARFACDCSGRRAVIGRAQGARLVHRDRLTAIACTYATDATDDTANSDPTILVEAVEDGWWYSAPLPRHRRVVAHFSDPDLVDVARARAPGCFASLLRGTRHIADVVSAENGQPIDAPAIFPAGTRALAPAAGPGWLAVGDAAATFDPLSSQGILTALLMGREAGRAAGNDAHVDYLDCVRQVVDTYHREHAEYYAAERRWPGSPFWSRRQVPYGTHCQRT